MIKLIKKFSILFALTISTFTITSATPQLSTSAMEQQNIHNEINLHHLHNAFLCARKPNLKNIEAINQYMDAMLQLESAFSTYYKECLHTINNLKNFLEEKQSDFYKIVEKYSEIFEYLKHLFYNQQETNIKTLVKIKCEKNAKPSCYIYPFEKCSEVEKQFYYGFEKLCWYFSILDNIIKLDMENIVNFANNITSFNASDFINNCFAASLEEDGGFMPHLYVEPYDKYENLSHFPLGDDVKCIHIENDDVAAMINQMKKILTLNK